MVKRDWIKPGAVVIDVGTNSVDDPTKANGCVRRAFRTLPCRLGWCSAGVGRLFQLCADHAATAPRIAHDCEPPTTRPAAARSVSCGEQRLKLVRGARFKCVPIRSGPIPSDQIPIMAAWQVPLGGGC